MKPSRPYLYCIADGPGSPILRGRGLRGADVASMPFGGVWALWSEFAGAGDFMQGDVMAHEAVIELAMTHSAVLPMRFGAVFAGAEAIRRALEGRHPQFRAALDRLAGKVEVGVKVLWKAGEVKEEIRTGGPKPGAGNGGANGHAPGTNYLLGKFREHLLARGLEERAAGVAGQIHGRLARCASEAQVEILPTENLVFAGSYLVGREELEGFRARFERIRAGQPGLRFLYAGPWPPYSFAGAGEPGGEEPGSTPSTQWPWRPRAHLARPWLCTSGRRRGGCGESGSCRCV